MATRYLLKKNIYIILYNFYINISKSFRGFDKSLILLTFKLYLFHKLLNMKFNTCEDIHRTREQPTFTRLLSLIL